MGGIWTGALQDRSQVPLGTSPHVFGRENQGQWGRVCILEYSGRIPGYFLCPRVGYKILGGAVQNIGWYGLKYLTQILEKYPQQYRSLEYHLGVMSNTCTLPKFWSCGVGAKYSTQFFRCLDTIPILCPNFRVPRVGLFENINIPSNGYTISRRTFPCKVHRTAGHGNTRKNTPRIQ